jgi:hypothetical protein
MNVEIGIEGAIPRKNTYMGFSLQCMEQPMIVTISFEILKLTASHATQSAPQVSDSL